MPSLTINDSMVGEGDSGSATGWFPVYLSAASTQTVTVNYSTSPGTATAGVDYASGTGTLTFVPGDTVEYIPVTIYGDTAYEPNDYFYLNLSSATNATIADNQSVVSIQNNDPDTTNPAIFVTDASVTEGNTGTATTTFTVSLSQATGSTVTVNYTTNPGSAAAGVDYTSASGTLTFAPGETSKTVTVSVLGDTTYEANETFYLDLSNPVNAYFSDMYGVGTITNDDAAPTLSVNDVSVTEGDSGQAQVTFQISLSTASTQTVSVNWASAEGTATVGSDYPNQYGSINFLPGQTVINVTVSVYSDTTYEPNETFYVNLSSPVGAVIADGQGVGDHPQRRPDPADPRRQRPDRDRGEQWRHPDHIHRLPVVRQCPDRHR